MAKVMIIKNLKKKIQNRYLKSQVHPQAKFTHNFTRKCILNECIESQKPKL